MLDAWAASPHRFREDANAEEDLALGGYRDRLLIELAQNAADAAAKAGVPGVLRVRLTGGVLSAANNGAPLDAAGVAALSSLRASAKRGADTVGRFGVGFASVLAVTDSPEVASRDGGVRFSAAQSRQEAEALPALAAELSRRGGAGPVLRLPWPLADPPPPGFTTEVRLPLGASAFAGVGKALADLDGSILLALPALAALDLEGRLITRSQEGSTVVITDAGVATNWRVARAAGELAPELLADRPLEERERAFWSVLWAVPDGGLTGRQVLHAPTPSDEPLSVPARLMASFPLAPDRRHVAPGPLTDWLVVRCAEAYVDLVRELSVDPRVLSLVPQPGLAGAALDAALCRAILAGLRSSRWLPGGLLPSAARVLEAELDQAVPLLGDVIPGLLPARWSERSAQRPLQALGVRRLALVEVVEAVSGISRPPNWWRSVYAALVHVADREALATLPVPLADGRTVTGPRGLLLPEDGLPVRDLGALDVRLVHPDASHPLLERLGAVPASPWTVLGDARLRAQVEDAALDAEAVLLADAVLSLVAAAGIAPGRLPWLADLPLPATDGEVYPAGELLLPGSPLAGVVAADAPFGTVAGDLVERWGPAVLAAAGVLSTFAVLRAPEVDSPEHDLDEEAAYLDDVLGSDLGLLDELAAVRDLELVAPDRWPAALELLAAEPLRDLIVTDALVVPGGRRVPSYTRWWLARHPILDGQRPDELRLPGAQDLAGLYDLAAGDPTLLRLLGCRGGLAELLADEAGARSLLDRLGDPARTCAWATLRQAYRCLADVLVEVEPPPTVRVAPRLVVAADDAMVLDAPYALPLLDDRHAVPGGAAVARLLDLPLASELVGGAVAGARHEVRVWSDVPGAELAADRLAATLPATTITVHSGLSIDGVAVPWWADIGTDYVEASAGPAVLGRALAWRLRRWSERAAAVEALQHPDAEDRLRVEDAAE